MLPEQKTVVSDAKVSTEKPAIDHNSSTVDILSSREEADDSEESTSLETEQSDESGDDVNAHEEEGTSEKSDDETEVKEGSPVPYTRFKQVNEKAKQFESDYEKQSAELEEARTVLQDPDILELALKKRGYTDAKIAAYFVENGIERKQKDEESTEDLETVDGWKGLIQNEIKKALQPVQQILTQRDKEQQKQEHAKWVTEQEKEAATLAKDRYGIEFGTIRKDETNPNTAVGKMWAYLEKNPDDAKLGYVKLLKLAMSDDAVSKGEEKGVRKEKARQVKLKTAAMEDETNISVDEKPDASWLTERIIDYRHKHGDE